MDHYEIPASLSIGYDNIDEEHQALIDILNATLQQIQTTPDVHVHAFYGVLEDLRQSLKTHFAHEEREMAHLDYPDLAQHKVHHLRCFQRFDEACDAVASQQIKMDKDFLDELFDMIIGDIIRADSAFKSFLEGRDLLVHN